MRKKLVVAIVVLGMLILIAACNGNKRPTAVFSVNPLDGPSPLSVDFKSLSHDPDGEIVAHDWDFGDGEVGSGQDVTHTFVSETDRQFNVRLTVTDDDGATDSYRGWVDVYGSNTEPTPGEVLFFDDFEDGIDPAWQKTAGWEVDNGVLVHESRGGAIGARLYLQMGTGWTNYIVEVDVEPRGEIVGLMLRCQEDLRSYVQFWGYSAWLRCKSYVDGEGGGLPDSRAIAPGFLEGEQHVRIVVSASTYNVYINDLLRLTFTDETHASGMPGLYSSGYSNGDDEARFDNFRVTALH